MRMRGGDDPSSGDTGRVSHCKSLCEQLTGRVQGQELRSILRMSKQLLNNCLSCFSNETHYVGYNRGGCVAAVTQKSKQGTS